MFKFIIVCAVGCNVFALLFHLVNLVNGDGSLINGVDMKTAEIDTKVMGVVLYFVSWFIGGNQVYFKDVGSYETVVSHCAGMTCAWGAVCFFGLFIILINKKRTEGKARRKNSSALLLAVLYGLCAFFLK